MQYQIAETTGMTINQVKKCGLHKVKRKIDCESKKYNKL